MKNARKEITITPDSLFVDVEKEFTSFYPFLKLEFFKNDTGIFSKNDRVSSGSMIREITDLTSPVEINVDENKAVSEVEKDCYDILGLFIQVCRKSGNVWNAISITRSWTLMSQNKAGEFISNVMQRTTDV